LSAESPAHRTLVEVLVSELAQRVGKVSHAAGVGALPTPPNIGRHEPDALARDANAGTLVIGEAKIGADMVSDHSAEQLHDFTTYLDPESGEVAALVLAVPDGWEQAAIEAVNKAGGDAQRVHVIPVRGLGVPPPSRGS
jgi:hypothetical protein